MNEEKNVHAVSLGDLIIEDHVAVKVQTTGWEDAVIQAGKLLVNTNIVEESYVEAMISTIKDLGPYCVIAPGIALPHARPEDGVRQSGFSLITLEQAVEFGNTANDPVDIVIGFAAIDKTSHILALREVATLLGDDDFIQHIRSQKTKSELIQLIKTQRTKL